MAGPDSGDPNASRGSRRLTSGAYGATTPWSGTSPRGAESAGESASKNSAPGGPATQGPRPNAPPGVPSLRFRMRDKYIVLGDYQTGKTTFLKWLYRGLPRVAVFDAATRWGSTNTAPSRPITHFAEFKSVLKGQGANPRKGRLTHILYQPGIQNAEECFVGWCEEILKQDNLLAIVDEPWAVMTSRSADERFQALARVGHARGIGLCLATHRFHGDVPAIVRMCDHFVFYRMSIDADLYAIRDIIGPEGAEAVRTLPRWHWYYRGLSPEGEAVAGVRSPVPIRRVPKRNHNAQ